MTLSLGTAAIYSVLGLATVFFALILLLIMTTILTKVIPAEAKKKVAPAPETPAPKAEPKLAPGTAGEFKLHNVDPRDAAMCMAIIADELKKPLNELRFISIKEIEE